MTESRASKVPPLLSVALGLAAVVLGVLALRGTKLRSEAAVLEDRFIEVQAVQRDLAALSKRIEDIEARIRAGAGASGATSPADPSEQRALEERLSALEEQAKALERTLAQGLQKAAVPSASPAEAAAPTEARAAKKQSAVLVLTDPSRSPKDRLGSLHVLRAVRGLEGDAVLGALVSWMREERDPAVLADVIRNGGEMNRDEMADALVEILERSAVEEVREEAAESLGKHRHRDRAVRALERAALNDPSESVRKQAQAAIEGRDVDRRPGK